MHAGINEFLEEQTQGLKEMVENLRKSRVEAARKAALESASRIKALNSRVRELARSGVQLANISQGAAERLIELQSEIVTTALSEAAEQLQRIADTGSVRELARGQAEVLQAARQRIVEDIARAVKILKGAAGDARKVATRTRTAARPAKTASRKTGTKRAAPRAKRAAPKAKRKATRTARRRRTAAR
jgi:phasin family protein